MSFNPQDLFLYPTDPGIYLMKNKDKQVLYIGKAKNLRARLKQYFAKQDERAMVPYLVSQVHFVDTIVTLTEKDALLLENTLIKQHQPKYNVLLKDDKTFVSLKMTRHQWPMLRLVRYKGEPKDDGTYFGPYTNALAARQTYDLILKLFPLRQCSDAEFSSRGRPCLLYDMKRCPAPCVGKCSKEEYQPYVDSAIRLLKGQDKEVVRDLKKKMEEASKELEFEKAKDYLHMIEQIEHVTTVQHVENISAKDTDVIGLYREADAIVIALLMFRLGKLIGAEHFSFHDIASGDEEIVESFLVQHYQNAKEIPKDIFVPMVLTRAKALEEIISAKVFSPKIGNKRALLEMAEKNAHALFIREKDARSLNEKRLLDLQELLQLTRFPRRIECLDTSNIAGQDAVASLVCFVNGKKDSSRMRLFKIRTQGRADDYSSMREAISRHFLRQKETNDFCDLFIVDGGKGQLNIALEIFEQLDIASVDVIGVSKENARHDKGLSQEKIYLPHQKEPIVLSPRSPLLFLLQQIRDEAHRVAIEYHRKQRSKRTISSELDSLQGIGPIKKKRLLTHFGSVKAIRAASVDELKKIKGLTKKDIECLDAWKAGIY